MAKDVSPGDDEKFDKMDDESLGFLEQVRKGKARFFVLSMKGNKVRSMIVKKKPIKEKDKKAARGEGYQPVFGVATGMGAKVTFTLARSDGFDEKDADLKTEKLKKFLSTQTGKPMKPTFELVDVPLPIPFDDDELNDPLIARFMAMETRIVQACDASPESKPSIESSVNRIRELLQDEETRASAAPKMDEFERMLNDVLAGTPAAPTAAAPAADGTPAASVGESTDTASLADQFKSRLTSLVPRIKEAAGTNAGENAKLKASEAGVMARKQAFAEANALLDEAEAVLNAAAPSTTAADNAASFKARLASLLPRIKAAVGTAAGEEAKLKASEAGVFARKQDFGQANALLDQVEQALDQASAAPVATAAAPSGDDFAQQVKDRLTRLIPQLKEAAGTPHGNQAKVKASEAGALARQQEFEQALARLSEAEALLQSSAAETPATAESAGDVEAPVDWATAKLQWQAASDKVDGQIAQLQSVLKKSDDQELVEIAEFGLNALTGNFKVPLMAAIRDIDGGQGAARAKAAAKALQVVQGFRDHIVSSEQVTAVDNNPFGVELTVRRTLLPAFESIETALQQLRAV